MGVQLTAVQRRVAFATLIGSAIEWYDFFIYGTAAALVFSQLFFPQFSQTAGTLLAFGTFAVGWVGRPIGGLICGHFGDRVGRKTMLVVTLAMMGVSTTLIGLLPDYSTIGVGAPLLLVTLRILQGISIGGEFGGGISMAVEYAPEGRRGLFGSFPQFGLPLGLVLGTLAFLAVSQLDKESFMAWGWRIPFLMSVLLLGVGLYIRLSIEETPEFVDARARNEVRRVPFVEAVTRHPWPVLAVMLGNAASGTFFYSYSTYFLSYLTAQQGYPRNLVLLSVSLAACVQMVTLPLMASLADRVGRKRVYVAANLGLGLTVVPAFLLLGMQSVPLMLVIQMFGLGFLHASSQAAAPSLYADMFPASIRYTGISLGYQFSGLIWAGPLPAVATALIAVGGGKPWYFVGYMILTSLISAVTMALARVRPQSEVEAARGRSRLVPSP